MSFLFFGRKKNHVIKQAEAALEMTSKVLNYRRDILAAAAVAELEQTRSEIAGLLAQSRGKQAPRGEGQGGAADLTAALKAQISQASERLRRHGGKIYPQTFASENIEMLVVAAILAIGIRSFFFQPFKIPTNSMWPTYAGMIPVVYEPGAPRPSAAQRALNKVLYWSQNYYITTPVAGEVVIPLLLTGSADGTPTAQLLRNSGMGKQFFGLRQVPESHYQVYIGNTNLDVTVPQDFPLESVILKSYFPEYSSLYAALEAYRKEGRVATDAVAGSSMMVYVIRTGVQLKPGEAVLDFDIKTGDMLFVDRVSYNFARPQIGDPIVFRTDNIPGLRLLKEGANGLRPDDFLPDERYYIKRLVGIGGDTLEVQGNTLYRNGAPITGADAFELNATHSDQYPGYQPWFALAPGKADSIKDGFFYAMGDNSAESHDSRSWGYEFGRPMEKRTTEERSAGVPQNQVPDKDVVGKAIFIFYPFEPRWGLAK